MDTTGQILSLSFVSIDGTLYVMTSATAEQAPPNTKPLTVHLLVAADALDIGHRAAYDMAKTGELAGGIPVIRTPRKTRVPVKALENVLGPMDDWLIARGLMSAHVVEA